MAAADKLNGAYWRKRAIELAEKQNILRNTLISMEQEKLSLRQDKAQLDLDVSRKKRA